MHINMDFPHAAGALVSTVSDLYRFMLAVDAGLVVRRSLVDSAWTSATLNDGSSTGYGYGWSITEWNSKRIVEHGGGIPGFVTHALWLPEEQLFVAVLGNRDGGNPNPQVLAREAMAAVLGGSYGPQEITIDPAIFDAYVGEYELAPNFILKVWRDGNAFWTQATGQSAFNIYPESESRFFLKVVPAAIQFAKNEQGEVTHLTLFQAGREMPARKIK
jgi:CubicO group peptidase (beta-lactamase class C family)